MHNWDLGIGHLLVIAVWSLVICFCWCSNSCFSINIPTICASVVIFRSCWLTIESSSSTISSKNAATNMSDSVRYSMCTQLASVPIASGQSAKPKNGMPMNRKISA